MAEHMSAETVELKLTDAMRAALDHALADARACLESDGGMMPFTVICTSDGYEVHEHPGDDVEETYGSVRTLIARELPEAYLFSYDGFIDLDAGREDAVLCEIARRGVAAADLLALPYSRDAAGAPVFADAPVSVGKAKVLYPSGTKPIVSGLVQLAAEREAASAHSAAPADTKTAGSPDETKE